ncbi:NYN domain-containing protein [Bacterioplanoides pacificum]|uniref:NYN domain-containing protein n=1 Tax=Bacterioplanoides pacificum TaxID=1171596 RepID=A0ABV7VQH0_9GAMM
MKTIIYIDGYNLYYGCLKHSEDKWLDLRKLFSNILATQSPHSELVQIKYFTADIKAAIASNGQAAMQAQQSYHRALQALYPNEVDIIKGYYSLEKANLPRFQSPPDKSVQVAVWKLEEKQTDVNIALHAYRDVCRLDIRHIVIVSNDTDLAPALQLIRQDYGDTINIGVVIPTRKSIASSRRPGNKQLSSSANWTRKYITDAELSRNHLPDLIPTRKKPIRKPQYW